MSYTSSFLNTCKSYRDFHIYDSKIWSIKFFSSEKKVTDRLAAIYGKNFVLGSYLTAPLELYENNNYRYFLLDKCLNSINQALNDQEGLPAALALGSICILVDVVARAILSIAAYVGSGINSWMYLASMATGSLARQIESEEEHHSIDRILERTLSGLSQLETLPVKTAIYARLDPFGITATTTPGCENFDSWYGEYKIPTPTIPFHEDTFLFSFTQKQAEVNNNTILLNYAVEENALDQDHIQAATKELRKQLDLHLAVNPTHKLEEMHLFLDGTSKQALIKVHYITEETDQEKEGTLTIAGAQKENPSAQEKPSSTKNFGQQTVRHQSPSSVNQLTTYKEQIEHRITACNQFYRTLRKEQDDHSKIKCFQLFSFDLGGSTFDTYKKGHHVTFVFSLNPDCSEAVKAKQAEKHTIEVLDDKGEVLKTYARELTQESLDRMQENRLQITTDYILNFIQAVSVKYNWVPAAGTVSSFSATSDKHSSHLDGSLAVKINLPDRIGAVSKSTLEWNTLFKTIESA